jgi:predicted transposase YbfD/YdcC
VDDTPASLWNCLSDLRDPRASAREKTHPLLTIVGITLCAAIAGADDWPKVVVFAQQRLTRLGTFLDVANGVPSRKTFKRVFAALSPHGLSGCLLRWPHGCGHAANVGHVAIDGKASRSSGRESQGLGMLHLVSAWATEASLSLGQVACAEKSNEITAIPELLNLLSLKGALVTVDAMGRQKAIAKQIVDRGGDYAPSVKDNQPNPARDVLGSFIDAQEVDYEGYEYDTCDTFERGHGRVEKRSYTVLYDVSGIRDRQQWEKLTVIGMCYRERTVGDRTSEELSWFIGSRRADAKVYGDALRGHWGIENKLHWHLGVTFGEDSSSIANRNEARNVALLRKWALGLLQRHPDKASISTKRYRAAMDTDLLQEILRGGQPA